jgi:phosphatidyl-myo-inositol alpha-mannosyltransferase
VRIGIVTPYSWTVPGGVNEHVANLASRLEEIGHETWILAPTNGSAVAPAHWPLPSGQFLPVGSAHAFRSNGSTAYVSYYPFMLQRMGRELPRHGFDVLHVHEPCAPAAAAAATFRSPYPTVGTFHAALDHSPLYSVLSPLVRRAIARLDVRIVVSEEAAKYLEPRFPGEYRVIPNGVDIERYALARPMPTIDGRILFIGRAEPRKGLPVLLRAFEIVRRQMPWATLALAGARPDFVARLAKEIYEEGVPPASVEVLGWVDLEKKVEQMGQAQVLCAPSLEGESFGIVLTEAMAAGLPVVASDLPGYRAVLDDGRSGMLVRPNDPDTLARELIGVLRDAELRHRLTVAGAVAVQDYSWKQVACQVLAAYEMAIEARSATDTAEPPALRRRPWPARQKAAFSRDAGT